MPELVQALRQQDYGYLQITAQLWALTITSRDFSQACNELGGLILNLAQTEEFFETLNDGDMKGISSLVDHGGRKLWNEFVHEFGSLREMGPGKRDREPLFKPNSVTENLFYRAVLGRAFFNTGSGPLEFAYIPDDLLRKLNNLFRSHNLGNVTLSPPDKEVSNFTSNQGRSQDTPGHPARPEELATKWMGSDQVLDDATTYLAAIRTSHMPSEEPRLEALLQTADLLENRTLNTSKVKDFLESTRADAHAQLISAWKHSTSFNELHLIPSLECEGEWQNQPQATRSFIINELAAIPAGKWWSMSSFINSLKMEHPHFQRPAGEYDSWFIKRTSDGRYLRGFDHWDEVEGELIRFFIRKILHWLGLADLAANSNQALPTAFRITARLVPQLDIEQIRHKNENGKLKLRTTGKISVSTAVPRAVRYQLARYCEWGQVRSDEIQFWITASSLAKAKSQGLKTGGLMALLSKNTEAGIPPSLLKAIQRWEKLGAQSRIEQELVLKVSQPAILEQLRKSKANRFLGEVLGPTAVVLKPGAQLKVWEILAELGYLVEDTTGTTPK